MAEPEVTREAYARLVTENLALKKNVATANKDVRILQLEIHGMAIQIH